MKTPEPTSGSEIRDLLIVFAYHFPPENSVGGARPYRFYKYLSRQGVRCRVFTAVDISSRPDLDAETVTDPFVANPRVGLGWQLERAFRRFCIPGSNGSQWAFRAAKAAARFLDTEYPGSQPHLRIALLSTYPPLGTPLAAYLLARNRHLPWIADFRDPMAGNPGSGDLNAFHRSVYRFAERLFVSAADCVIANTDASLQKMQYANPRHAAKMQLLWNGFDPEHRVEPLAVPATRTRYVYSHVGELYEGRSMAPLLHSIGRLIESGKLDPSQIQIQQVGPVRAGCLPDAEFNAAAESQGWLKVVPHQVPQSEAQKIAQESDGLLLVQPHSALQVPGKLFEYIQIGRPILAFIAPESPVERILSQSGIPFQSAYVTSPPETMDEAVFQYFHFHNAPARPSDWFENMFDGERHADQLFKFIQEVHQNRGAG